MDRSRDSLGTRAHACAMSLVLAVGIMFLSAFAEMAAGGRLAAAATLGGDAGHAVLTAQASGVSYVERSWSGGDTDGSVVSTTKSCSSYSTLSSSSKSTSLGTGWYVLSSNVEYSKSLQITGDAKVILCDGKTLTAKDGIYIKDGCTLTVYGQSGDSGTIKASSDDNSGIGGKKKTKGGNLVVHGGTISAQGDTNAAGIGGGNKSGSGFGNVTIYGGSVTAKGGSSGAGIGKGQQNDSFGTVCIYGGTVTATGGNYAAGIGGGEDRGSIATKIYGGTVTATGGKDGAGIGGGEGGAGTDAAIEIYGGTVTASSTNYGAGIGGGENGKGGTVTIKGGSVTATGGNYGAGIGGGKNSDGGTVTISGGTVSATGTGQGAGIGGGNGGGGGTLTVNGGTVTANGGSNNACAIGGGKGGAGGTFTINSGNVTANGGGDSAGIGGDDSVSVTIHGGTVVAKAGEHGDFGGVGIGVLNGGGKLYFDMDDGNVTAKGGGSEDNGAGIGGGSGRNVELHITISGGTVNATGGPGGAGIGSGCANQTDYLFCMGGDVNSGSEITISGGTVTAKGGKEAAGIGAGFGGNQKGTITISGGTVEASGGTHGDHTSNNGGAGIGGGAEGTYDIGGNAGTIKILGGTVHAQAGANKAHAIGHGGGDENDGDRTIGDSITVSYDSDFSSPYSASQRMDCFDRDRVYTKECTHPGNAYTSTESTHTQSCSYCKTSFSAEAHSMDEQNKCTVCGYQGALCTVSFASGDGTGTMGSVKVVPGSTYQLPACEFSAPENMAFKSWSVQFEGQEAQDVPAGQTVTVPESTSDFTATATAVWSNQCVVSFDSNGGSGSMEMVLVDVGSDYTLPECDFTAPNGKIFKEWSVVVGNAEAVTKNSGEIITASDHVTATAVWGDAVTVTLKPGNNVSGETITTKVLKGGTLTLPTYKACGFDPPEGFEFEKWSVKIGLNTYDKQPGETVTVSQDATATAKWENSAWTTLENWVAAGGTITLDKDYTAAEGNSKLIVPSGKTVTLDLNGHTVDGSALNYILHIKGTLTLKDSVGTGELKYQGDGTSESQIVQVQNGGSFNLTGGEISCSGKVLCGVYVYPGGSFSMSGGELTCIGTSCFGVHVREGASFTMSGGKVYSKGNSELGGMYGVYLDFDGGANFTMSGGTVICVGTKSNGVYVNEDATFTMSGGRVSCMGETSCGVNVLSGGDFSIEGDPDISNDTNTSYASTSYKVYLQDDGKITVSGALADDALINVYTQKQGKDNPFTSGLNANAADDSAYGKASNFEPYTSGFATGINESGEAYFGEPCTVTYQKGDDDASGTMDSDAVAKDSTYTLPQCGFTAAAGKSFKEWSVKIGDAEAVIKNPGDAITVTANTTVTAVWGEAVIVTLDAGEGSGNLVEESMLKDSTYALPTYGECMFTPPSGCNFKEWSVKIGDAEAVSKDPGDTITVTANTTVTAVWELAYSVQVYGHTLTLEGQIGLNTYLVLGSNVLQNKADYQVEYWNGDTLASKTSVSSGREATAGSYTLYGFAVTTVAKEMGVEFTMKVKQISTDEYIDFYNCDRTLVDGDTGLAYSVTDYLDDMIANSTDSNMVQLAKDMKAYGTYAKHYFDVRDQGSTKALPQIDGFETVEADVLSGYANTLSGNISHFTYKGSTLVLESETAFRLYFESDNPDALTITTTVDGIDKTLTPESVNGMYYVEVPNIVAKRLDDMYDITISNGTEIATAHHGPFGYAYWALSSSSNENLRYLMMALYHYNQSAKDYFNRR